MGTLCIRSAVITLCAGSAFSLVTLLRSPMNLALDLSLYPVGAVRYLAAHAEGGNVLLNFNVGSFALWELWPRFRVAVDGRYEEVYPESTVATVHYALTPSSPRHRDSLRKVDPDFILTEVKDRDGFGAEWRIDYDNGTFVVLSKNKP